MKLTTKWEEFSKQIDNLVDKGKAIAPVVTQITDEQNYDLAKRDFTGWKENCFEILKSSFDEGTNQFVSLYQQTKLSRYNTGGPKKEVFQLKKELQEDLNEKIDSLIYIKRIISISDAILKPEVVNLVDRNSYETEETLELILEKLYELYDNSYHSIRLILWGNGIEFKRHHEDGEFGKVLEDYGYVTLINLGETLAQLTLHGKMYIEAKRKVYLENYDDLKNDKEELNSKVDEILDELNKLGLGQEIVFDEIQELKTLYVTLSKKNWGQVVKGKLVDLSLAKLIENDTVSYIYEKLTDHQLRLP